jgi:hypothetical protein
LQEIIDLFDFIVKTNQFIQKKTKEVNGHFGEKKVKSIDNLGRILVGKEKDELSLYFFKLNKKMEDLKFDFPVNTNVSNWKKLKEIVGDNPRADLQIISYEAKELIRNIKRDVEVINDDEFIVKVKNSIKKLSELNPWEKELKGANK